MSLFKIDPVDGLYRENTADDGSEAMTLGLAALYDGDKSTPASLTSELWWYHFQYGLDLGAPREVDKLICYDHVSNNGWYSAAHDSVKVFTSDDNITWTFLEQFDAPTRTNGVWELVFSATKTARYFKAFNCESSSTLGDPVGTSLKVTEIEAWGPESPYRLTGTISEKGVAAVRTVRAYIRSTGELFASVESDPDGTFELPAPDTTTEMFVIAFDDDAGDQYNDLIFSKVKGV